MACLILLILNAEIIFLHQEYNKMLLMQLFF